jgi:S1-C subfamily serine protease
MKMGNRYAVWILAVWSGLSAVLAGAAEPEKSVVQIFTFSQPPVWEAPWRSEPVRRSGGTGFVIKGKRIMTNAHVVSWARQILVKRYQDPRPCMARVVFIGHDCDLALLEVDDAGFFDGMEPLDFGELAKVRSTVVTMGYPAGGEQISYTRGVVSRIELQNYTHIGNRALLGVQTDAAINPGNSGGPVIQDDLVVGVAFQGMPGLENTGFFIPTPVIQHFLKDIADGTYHGYPSAGIRVVPLQNPAHRRALRLEGNTEGARVDSLFPIPSTEKALQNDDVLLQVGTYRVGSDSTILYHGNRLHLAAALQDMQHGESIHLKIWRDGVEKEVDLQQFVYDGDKTTGNQYDDTPRYFIHGGLVFAPLSLDYLKTLGRNWSDAASAEVVYELFYRRYETPALARREPIVLVSVLPHSANANFGVKGRALVDKINGVRINRLEDVIKAFQSPPGAQHVLEFAPHNSLECLAVEDAQKAGPEILKTYNIPQDRHL